MDLAPTIQELLGTRFVGEYDYDGVSYAKTVTKGEDCGKDHLVLTQCAQLRNDVYTKRL